jgi:hypothetical protein
MAEDDMEKKREAEERGYTSRSEVGELACGC